MANGGRLLCFDEYGFDPRTGELSGPRGRRRLQPKPAAVLALLLERSGELVEREELRDRLWPDTRVEFDQGLNYCIRQIRAALDEDANEPRFIETLPRRGYRFLRPVRHALERDGSSTSPAAARNGRARARLAWTGAISLVAAIALAAIGLGRLGPSDERRAGEDAGDANAAVASSGDGEDSVQRAAVRLAVLPLSEEVRDDLSADDTAAALDALLQAIVIELTRVDPRSLGVVGPATTANAPGGGRPQTEIGLELDVDYVLSGGHRVEPPLTFVQIIRVPDGAHMWGRQLDPANLDPRAMAGPVATDVLQALEAASGVPLRSR